MPNWMPSLYPGGRARLIPRRTSFNAPWRSAGSAARYPVMVDAGMGHVYHESFCRGNCNVRIHAEARISRARRDRLSLPIYAVLIGRTAAIFQVHESPDPVRQHIAEDARGP